MVLKKLIAVIMSFLVISLSFISAFNLALIFSTPNAEAFTPYCCIQASEPEEYCIDVESETQDITCDYNYKRTYTPLQQNCSVMPECQKGVCVVDDACLVGIKKRECEDGKNGRFYATMNPNSVPECKQACCFIPPGQIAITTKQECKSMVLNSGQEWSDTYFDPSITDEGACFNKWRGEDYGCCIMENGYEYTSASACGLPVCGGGTQAMNCFMPNTFCSEVPGSGLTPCANIGCAKLDKDKGKICCFDSAGNQEWCPPNLIPQDLKELSPMKNKTGNYNYACNYPSELCKICTNESGCYDAHQQRNVEAGMAYCKNADCIIELKGSQKITRVGKVSTKVERVHSGSTTILNYHSICYNFYSGHASKLSNYGSWGEGDDNRLLGLSIGLQNQVLSCQEGEVVVSPLGPDRKRLCKEVSGGYAKEFENRWENCMKCKEGGWQEFLALGGVGTTWLAPLYKGVICSPDDCVQQGDCVFDEDYNIWGVGGVGACIPLYPPGNSTTAFECGGGGDALLNFCNERECLALGNTKFRPIQWYQATPTWIYRFYGSVIFSRLGFIVPECLIIATIGAFGCPTLPFCYPPAFAGIFGACTTELGQAIIPKSLEAAKSLYLANKVLPTTNNVLALIYYGGVGTILTGFQIVDLLRDLINKNYKSSCFKEAVEGEKLEAEAGMGA